MKPFEKEPPDALDALLAQVCRLHYARAYTLLEAIGLYRGQPPLLMLLAREGELTHSEVASRLRIAPATVTKMIQRLERAGFVRRSPDAYDRRVSRLALTAAGEAVQARMQAVLRQMEDETFAGFTEEDRTLLRRLLFQARRNLLAILDAQHTPESA